MRPSRPPVVATWLLVHFLSGPEQEHIVGDLVEAYRSGRSRIWYWKEVLAAIANGTYTATTERPILAVRALFVGWAVLLFWDYVLGPALAPLVRHFVRLSGYPLGPSMLIGFGLALSVRVSSGWLVASFHRSHRTTTVLLFAASVFIYYLRWLPGVWRAAANTLTNTRFLPYFIYGLELQFVLPAAILLGGPR